MNNFPRKDELWNNLEIKIKRKWSRTKHDWTRKAETFTGDVEKYLQTINYKSGETPSEGEVENYGKLMDWNTGEL